MRYDNITTPDGRPIPGVLMNGVPFQVTPRPLRAWADPAALPLDAPVQVTFHAEDAQTLLPVNGKVLAGGIELGATNTQLNVTIASVIQRVFDPTTRRWDDKSVPPVVHVVSPGYADTPVAIRWQV